MSEPRDDEFWQQSQDARRARLPRYAWICLAGLLVGGVLVAVVVLLGNGSTDSARDEPRPADGQEVTIYADPGCGCCGSYADYLRNHGFAVTLQRVDDMDAVKSREGVPADGESCHTTLVAGYVVEGHVPVAAIDQLLDEKPVIDGITLPGMPAGSPGMGDGGGPFEILSIDDGALDTYTTA